MPEKAVEVKIGSPIVLHLVEEITDVLLLIGGNLIFIRRLDGNGITLVGIEPRFLLVRIGIHLDQIATRQGTTLIVFRRHLCDSHTVLVNLHLIAQLVAAFILAIEQHIDSCTVGGIGQSHAPAQFKG